MDGAITAPSHPITAPSTSYTSPCHAASDQYATTVPSYCSDAALPTKADEEAQASAPPASDSAAVCSPDPPEQEVTGSCSSAKDVPVSSSPAAAEPTNKPPRRAQTAINYFSSSYRRKLRKDGLTEEQMKQQVAAGWEQLSEAERQPYEAKADNDMQRYKQQLEAFLAAGGTLPGAGKDGGAEPAPKSSKTPRTPALQKVSLTLLGVSPSSRAGPASNGVRGSESIGAKGSSSKKSPSIKKGSKSSKGKASTGGKGQAGSTIGKKRPLKTPGGTSGATPRLKKARNAYQIYLAEMRPQTLAQMLKEDKAREKSPSGRSRKRKSLSAGDAEEGAPVEQGPSAEAEEAEAPPVGEAAEGGSELSLAQRVLMQLTRTWRSMPAEEKRVYEDREKEERALAVKEAQSAARRASAEGGYAKLREQIESFAEKQPTTFLTLMEYLNKDEKMYRNRQARQQQMEEKRAEREAEAARKLRYPISDDLLQFEPPPDPPLAPRPTPKYGLNLTPEMQPLAGAMLSACDFVETFGDVLGLSRIQVEDLRAALLHRGPSVLLTELHLGLLRVLVAPDPVEGAPDLDAKASAHYVAEHKVAEHKLLTAVIPTASMLNEHCWPEVLRWVLVGRCAPDDTEAKEALSCLATTEYFELRLPHKVALLSHLCDEVVLSTQLRERLGANMEKRAEYIAQEAKDEAERRAAALAEKKAKLAEESVKKEQADTERKEQSDAEGDAAIVDETTTKKKSVKKEAAGKESAKGTTPKSEDVALPPTSEYDYGDEQNVQDEGDSLERPSAVQRQLAKKEAERRQRLQDLKKARERAIQKLREAMAREDYTMLQEGIKLARAARMEGKAQGQRWRFPELSAALTAQEQLAERHKAAETLRIRKARLASCPLRHEPLGRDRERWRYWRFEGEPERLYVEIPAARGSELRATDKEGKKDAAGARKSRGRLSWAAKKSRSKERQEAAAEAERLAPPSVSGSSWRYFRNRHEVQQLLDSLDDRGVCERALRRSLQEEMAPLLANLASEKPQDDLHEWRSEGPFMGVRVRQMFEGVGASEATVSGYLPAEGSDPALWHIVHDDGDQEDLEEGELMEAIQRHKEAPEDGLQEITGPFMEWQNTFLTPKMRVSKKALGFGGLQTELRALLDNLVQPLQAAGCDSLKSADGSKAWRDTIASAGSASEYATLLLTLEGMVHGLQTEPDENESVDEEQGEDAEMDASGAEGRGACEGGEDEEESPTEATGDDNQCGDKHSRSQSRQGDEAVSVKENLTVRSIAKKEGRGLPKKGELHMDGKRLWPSAQARQRWRSTLGAASTCAQISLCTRSLHDHVTAFGLVTTKHASRSAAENRCSFVWDVV